MQIEGLICADIVKKNDYYKILYGLKAHLQISWTMRFNLESIILLLDQNDALNTL